MKLIVILTTMWTVLLGVVGALALPAELHSGIHERALAPSNAFAKANLSSLFGWQLAGSHMRASQPFESCSELPHKWAAIGLNTDYIKVPLCNSSASHNPGNVVPYTVSYTTKIFISQLLSAFNNTQAFAYVCKNIGFNMVASFPINDLDVVPAVCQAGGVQTKPRPEANLPQAPENAVSASRNTASILFAVIWATGATSETQLTSLCLSAPKYVADLNKQQLNGTLIQSTLCSIKSPISIGRARNLVKTWMSRYFTTVVENISHSKGWSEWLCNNLDSDRLYSAGLYGYGIQEQICSDSKVFPNNNQD